MTERNIGPQWLHNAIFYEIYPQSFRDTDGDGIGDLCLSVARNACNSEDFSPAHAEGHILDHIEMVFVFEAFIEML